MWNITSIYTFANALSNEEMGNGMKIGLNFQLFYISIFFASEGFLIILTRFYSSLKFLNSENFEEKLCNFHESGTFWIDITTIHFKLRNMTD